MRRLALAALLAVFASLSAVRAEAQPPAAALVLVVESSEGVTGANQLRATLSRQFGLKVMALGEVEGDGQQPGAMMAVATERSNAVRVLYIDAFGRRDSLRAPAPARREDMTSVIQALAGALLARHLRELTQPARAGSQDGDHVWFDEESRLSLSAFSRSLQNALSRLGYPRHRSGDLHRDDF
jgi:hypothetical protein